MTRLFCIMVFILPLFIRETGFAQGVTALPFLLISPSAEANGMGEAVVANYTDDPLALISNPAHLGTMSLKTHLSFGHDYARWLPGLALKDLYIRTYDINSGINLGMLTPCLSHVGVGFAFSRIHINYGDFNVTGENGPEVIRTVNTHESSEQYSIGLGVNYIVRFSTGITMKHINSNLASEAKATLYDYGILLDVPITGIISEVNGSPIVIAQHIIPYLNWSFGISKNNLGQESISYVDQSQADPLPRYARAGMGFHIGLMYEEENVSLEPLSFKWTIEANDLLVKSTGTNPEYQTGFGDIKIFDDVILGNTNSKTIKAKGWELDIFQIASIRGGRFEEDIKIGGRHFSTSGWSLRLAGIVKLLRTFLVPYDEKNIAWYLLNHLDFQYNYSNLITDSSASPLSGTEFNSINVHFVL